MATKKIWPIEIPVIGATGPYGSGKSLFGVTIDPKNTLAFDIEQSLCSYVNLGFTHVNMQKIMLEQEVSDKEKGRALFEYWYDYVKGIEPGLYSVIVVDPISDIEEGMVEWVKSRYREWGFKTSEAFVSTGGIFWAKVKTEWKKILAELSVRCQTFFFTTHQKLVWKGGKPTNEKTSKGKSTLKELASLFLTMDRSSGKPVPSADVEKSRLAVTTVTEDGDIRIVPVLPPRLPEATPKRIREYILNPPDYDNLGEEERSKVKEFTDAERLELEHDIAIEKRAAEEAALKAEELRQKQKDAKEAAKKALYGASSAEGESKPADKVEAPADEGSSGGSSEDPLEEQLTDGDIDFMIDVESEATVTGVARGAYKILKGRGVDVSGFTSTDHDKLYKYLVLLKRRDLEQLINGIVS